MVPTNPKLAVCDQGLKFFLVSELCFHIEEQFKKGNKHGATKAFVDRHKERFPWLKLDVIKSALKRRKRSNITRVTTFSNLSDLTAE